MGRGRGRGRKGKNRGKGNKEQRREKRQQKEEQQQAFWWQRSPVETPDNGRGAQSPSGKFSKKQRRKNRQRNQPKPRATMSDHVVQDAAERVRKMKQKNKTSKKIRPLVPIELEDEGARSATSQEVVKV